MASIAVLALVSLLAAAHQVHALLVPGIAAGAMAGQSWPTWEMRPAPAGRLPSTVRVTTGIANAAIDDLRQLRIRAARTHPQRRCP
jgi:hypothetical protein